MYLVAVLCTVLLFGAQAQQIHFNNTYNCTSGCFITNQEIYMNNQPPTGESEVYFNVTQLSAVFIAPTNTTFNVTTLQITGKNTTLIIEANAIVNAEEISLNEVHIQVYGTLVGQQAELEGSTIVSCGHIKITEAELDQSNVFMHNGSQTYFEEFGLENGTIVAHEGSNFTVSDESEFSLSFLNFSVSPYLGDVEFESVTAYFPVGFYAENQFIISSSNFSAYFPDALSNVSFILAGKNNLTISNLNFNSDKIKINNTGTPFITFNVNGNATFSGNLTVPGDININPGANVNFNGTINLSGGLTALSPPSELSASVASSTQIRVTGNLIPSNILLVGYNDSFTVTNAIITTPKLDLEGFLLYSREGTTVINGDIINNGSVFIFESSSVIVNGNYTQLPNTSTFGAYNLDNAKDRPTNLVVNGTAQIDGHIVYNTSVKKVFTATIISSTYNISGKFATEEFYGDVDTYKPKLQYNNHTVDITINAEEKPWWQLDWWIWLLIGVGVVVILVALILIIRAVRNRASYEPVRTHN